MFGSGGAELLPRPEELVTTRAPTPGISPGQVAQPYKEFADTLEKASGASENLAETAATQAGYGAVTMNPDGSPNIEKAPIIGPASQDYHNAVKVAALTEGEGAAKDAARRFMVQYRNQPDAYLEALNAYKDKTIQQYSEAGAPDVGLAIGRAIDASTTWTYRELTNQKQQLDLHNAWQTIQDGRTSAANDLEAMARSGDTSSPLYQQALDKWNTLTQQAVANPALGYGAAKAQFDGTQLHAQLAGAVFLHHIDQVYGDTSANPDGTPKGGAANALEAARSILTDTSVNLSPAMRQQFYAKAVGEIRANEAQRRQSVQSARDAEAALDQSIYLGARVDPQEVSQVGGAFIAAGDQADAARFYAKMARKPLNDDFGRQPFPEQLDQLRTLQSGANPSSPAEARLINYESGGNPTRVNGLGYAGLYQFGAPLLTDLGLYKPGAGENVTDEHSPGGWSGQKWSGTFNIPGFPQVKTLRDFLSNPAAQKAAYDIHVNNMDAAIKANGLDKYIGQTVAGVPITQDGLRAMIHLGGVAGTLRTLSTGGKVNPPDQNGTTLLDYARLGAHGAQGTPSSNLWLAANRGHTVDTEAAKMWKGISAQYTKTGIPPADATLNQVVEAARLTGDHVLLDNIADGITRMKTAQRLAQEPLPAQSADIGTMQQAGQEGILTPPQNAVMQDLQRKHEAIVKGLAVNPIATTVANFSDHFQMPGPLNLGDPQQFAAGLAVRAKIAQFAAQSWQTGPVSALDAADLAQVKGALQTTDPAAKAAIFQGLSTLPADVRAATLKKLGGNSPSAMADVAAGSLMRSAPDVAQSIFRGQAALKADPKWDPEAGPNGKSTFSADLGTDLPASVFPLQARTDPTGPYATMAAMVRARYADLSAQANDTKYSAARVKQAVDDVTGGTVTMNGAMLIAPARGMTQGQFDGILQGVTDNDLVGVTTLNGQPITANYLRANAQLQSIGDGRYFVTLGRDPAKPIYAYTGATNSELPQKFVLDLRGRAPAARTASLPPPAIVGP